MLQIMQSKYYFTSDTQEAILEYNVSENPRVRNKIYETRIHKAFDKLVENTIHVNKLYYFDTTYEDAKQETISHLIEKMDRYTPESGNAYSYFTVVARNYLINLNNNNYKAMKRKDEVDAIDVYRNVTNEVNRQSKIECEKEFIDLFINFIDLHIDKFNIIVTSNKTGKSKHKPLFKSDEYSTVYAILTLFKTRDTLELFNKKALYIMIREMTGIERTQEISKVVHKVKELWLDLYRNWELTGKLTTSYL
jgi:hypothetical protein